MKARFFSAIVLGLALGAAATAQDAPDAAHPAGPPSFSVQGRHGPSGLEGTVTAVSSDSYTIHTDSGQSYTVNFSADTHILKQMVQGPNPGEAGNGASQRPQGAHPQMARPQTIPPDAVKVGDTIVTLGDVEPASHSVAAMMVLVVDPERARMMHDTEAEYGKTWLLGQITAIDASTITILGRIDNQSHAFTTDAQTRFRRHDQPISSADLQVGDRVRVQGAVRDGVFVADFVSVVGPPPGEMPRLPGEAPSIAQPQ